MLIPRATEAALLFLRDHLQMIDLNPLVIERHKLSLPPPNASPEEMHATWYQITDKISYLPGVTSSVSYNACMHDLADGLQTHTFAPAGVEIRGRWIIGGSASGEAPIERELGSAAPSRGLYLEETTDLKCNFLMTGFIKKNLKGAHAKVVEKIVEIARQQEPRPPVPEKDPGYHSRGPSQASIPGGGGGEEQKRTSYSRGASNSNPDLTVDSRKKFTPEYERYRQSQDAQSFGRANPAVRESDGFKKSLGTSPPTTSHVAELPAERPVSELP